MHQTQPLLLAQTQVLVVVRGALEAWAATATVLVTPDMVDTATAQVCIQFRITFPIQIGVTADITAVDLFGRAIPMQGGTGIDDSRY